MLEIPLAAKPDTMLTARVPAVTVDAVTEVAARLGVSRSEAIRAAITDWLAANAAPEAIG